MKFLLRQVFYEAGACKPEGRGSSPAAEHTAVCAQVDEPEVNLFHAGLGLLVEPTLQLEVGTLHARTTPMTQEPSMKRVGRAICTGMSSQL